MRDFNLITVAYENRGTPMEEYMQQQLVELINKYKRKKDKIHMCQGILDENSIRAELKRIKRKINKNEKINIIAFQSLEFDFSNPLKFDNLFCVIKDFAKENDLIIIVLLTYEIVYNPLSIHSFQNNSSEGGIEQYIDLLILVEPLWPDHNVARIIKNKNGFTSNYILDV